MKPMCMPSTTQYEFDCKIAALIETPDATSAEDEYYSRHGADYAIERTAPAAYRRDKDEEQALRIEALRQSPCMPGIAWTYCA
jgi:hypothetical protein